MKYHRTTSVATPFGGSFRTRIRKRVRKLDKLRVVLGFANPAMVLMDLLYQGNGGLPIPWLDRETTQCG